MSYLNQTLTLSSPAKLNLFLYINNQRADGYHELQTLFQFLDFGDTLTLTATQTSEIVLENPIEGVPNEANLIYRAAMLLKTSANVPFGARIGLQKRMPMGGGIGGGSSNAASVLLGLNLLWGCHLSQTELAELGLTLGADVPIFVHGCAAMAEGVGEKLQFCEPKTPWYLLAKPDCSVATGAIFSAPELPRNTPKRALNELLNSAWHNDCEAVVCARYPEIAALKAKLSQFAPTRLTGTGACLFAEFATEIEAREALDALSLQGFAVVAKGLNRSPVLAELDVFQARQENL